MSEKNQHNDPNKRGNYPSPQDQPREQPREHPRERINENHRQERPEVIPLGYVPDSKRNDIITNEKDD